MLKRILMSVAAVVAGTLVMAESGEPAPLNARDGGLWLAGMPDLPLLMGQLRLSEAPDRDAKQAFWDEVRACAGRGEPRRVIWLLRFGKQPGESGKIPSFENACRQIDAWFGGADGVQTCPELLLGVVPDEENTQVAEVDRLGEYLRRTYGVKCYQWLTEPWPPTLDLRADGWIFDAYSDNDEQFYARLEKFILYGKPVVPIVWGSADWGGSWGFYRGKSIDEQLAILTRRMEWCRSFDLPVIVFAVYGDLGSVNHWYYGGVESGKPEAFVAYRDAIVRYLKAMPTAPLPEAAGPEKSLKLVLPPGGTGQCVVSGGEFKIADTTGFDSPDHWQVTQEGLRLRAESGRLDWTLAPSAKLDSMTVTVRYRTDRDAVLRLDGTGAVALPAGSSEVSGTVENFAGGGMALEASGEFLLREIVFDFEGTFRRQALELAETAPGQWRFDDDFSGYHLAASLVDAELPAALSVDRYGVVLRGVAGYIARADLAQRVAVPPGATRLKVAATVQIQAVNYGGDLKLTLSAPGAEAAVAVPAAAVDGPQEITAELPLPAGCSEVFLRWELAVSCGVATPNAVPVRILNYTVEMVQ